MIMAIRMDEKCLKFYAKENDIVFLISSRETPKMLMLLSLPGKQH